MNNVALNEQFCFCAFEIKGDGELYAWNCKLFASTFKLFYRSAHTIIFDEFGAEICDSLLAKLEFFQLARIIDHPNDDVFEQRCDGGAIARGARVDCGPTILFALKNKLVVRIEALLIA